MKMNEWMKWSTAINFSQVFFFTAGAKSARFIGHKIISIICLDTTITVENNQYKIITFFPIFTTQFVYLFIYFYLMNEIQKNKIVE